MWPKFFILAMVAIFLVAICNPVVAHDGSIPNTIDSGDDHPWGGGNEGDGGDGDDGHPAPVIGGTQIYFSQYFVEQGWIALNSYFGVFLQGFTGQSYNRGYTTPVIIDNSTAQDNSTNKGAGN